MKTSIFDQLPLLYFTPYNLPLLEKRGLRTLKGINILFEKDMPDLTLYELI